MRKGTSPEPRSQPRFGEPAEPAVPDRPLHDFVKDFWRFVEPRTFVDGWHLEAICEHLEAVSRGDIRKLIINIPPRHTKSLTVSVFWPAWVWSWNPAYQWMFSSYGLHLTIRDNLRCRRLIESPLYQQTYPKTVMVPDQKEKKRYELVGGGYRLAMSVGGGTGDGADALVIDDPHNTAEALSDAIRQSTLDWYDQTWSTRLNDEQTGVEVLIMQRVHEQDLTGHLLETGEWERLKLPARYEPSRTSTTSLGEPDRRTVPGELLCPERMPEEQLAALEKRLGSYGTSGQLQQEPSDIEGGIFKRSWWKRYDETGPVLFIYVDTASKTGVHNDYSVASAWASVDGCYDVVDVLRGRWEYPDLKRELRVFQQRHGMAPMVIEDTSAGQALIQDFQRPEGFGDDRRPRLPVIAFKVGAQTKMARASVAAGLVESGVVRLPHRAAWVDGWIDEHASFPTGAHDDMVDTTSIMSSHLPLRATGGKALQSLFEHGMAVRRGA